MFGSFVGLVVFFVAIIRFCGLCTVVHPALFMSYYTRGVGHLWGGGFVFFYFLPIILIFRFLWRLVEDGGVYFWVCA